MKRSPILIGMALASGLLGCATTPVAVAPVGPNPSGPKDPGRNGQLEVFSALAGRTEGNNPTWFQHTDYSIYNLRGKPMKHVDNTVGYYASAPRLISLPPGKYFVRAEARDYLSVAVPVVIQPGQITKVHLDDAWQPPDVRKTAFVRLPAGNPVGWSADVN